MNSKIYVGTISHRRLQPTDHQFRYPIYYYAFDLAELPALDRQCILFGYNRWRPVSLYDDDYFQPTGDTLLTKTKQLIQQHISQPADIKRIMLLTAARYFHYVFNPISFFLCYDERDDLKHVLVEVNNTFQEAHLYLLQDPRSSPPPGKIFQIDKDFHVSPFFDRQGDYQFQFQPLGDTLDIQIQLIKQGETVFTASLNGQVKPFSTISLLKIMGTYPLNSLLTIPRIHWEAARLYFKRRLPIYTKPIPTSQFTIRQAPPSRWQRWCMNRIFSLLSRLQVGTLEVVLPDQSRHHFGNPSADCQAKVVVRDYRFFDSLVRAGEIGLGESYVRGEWDTEDVVGAIRLLIENLPHFQPDSQFKIVPQILARSQRWRHQQQQNSVAGSQQNIPAHYDLSNELYQLFLDETMTYSAAVFESPGQSLCEAQRHKLQRLIKKARLKPHHHLLEIGTGWGSLAIEAVQQTGCRVTTITISPAQARLAQERINRLGLEDKIQVLLCDYRTLAGQYDRIISIEMLEAVGHEFLTDYFRMCDRLLKPDGLIVLQTITIPDQRYEFYRQGFDWIRKYVFPGGHLPSLQVMVNALADHTQLLIDEVENIGPHYALTLARWRERFVAAKPAVQELGFEETFYRQWFYYLSFCEAAFATRHLNNLQLVLTRANNPTLNR